VNVPHVLTAGSLRLPGVGHGFFTRIGGVSQGVYASLNGGVGSRDSPDAVAENRSRAAAALGAAPERLAVPYQIHSADAVAISEPWAPSDRPRCDGLATVTPGLALGVTGADCGMILFADRRARVIGAAHAGWKGALAGVVDPDPVALAQPGGTTPRLDRPVVAVGPEGGFSPGELRHAPVTVGLGPTVLRAETAAVAAGVLMAALRAGTVAPGGTAWT